MRKCIAPIKFAPGNRGAGGEQAVRHRPHLIMLSLCLVVLLQSCAQLGGLGRRYGGDRRQSQEASSQPAAEVTRITERDQIRLHLSSVRTELKLSPEQAGLWQDYENRVLAALSAPDAGDSHRNSGIATEQIEKRVTIERKHIDALEEIAKAANRLYAVLGDEQKRIADRALAGTLPIVGMESPPARRRER